jgi:general secretion pathway protein K
MSFGAGFPRFRRSSRPTATEFARNERSSRGWALISVLWVVAILSMLAAASQQLTVTSVRTEHKAQDAARAASDLDAGVARAVAGIGDPELGKRWRIDGVAQDFAFDGLTLHVAVQDQLGCIDLNDADVSMLRQLLQAAGGLAPDQAASFADKIVDWRSPADRHSLHGATDADYAAAGYAWRERHGAFQTVDELKLVMGMTPELFARLAPALTVYSHRPGFDAGTAPREALMALYFSNPQQATAIMAARLGGTGLTSGNQNSVPQGILGPSASLGGRAFAVDAALDLKGKRFTRHAVIETTGDDKRPYFVLAWR